MLVYVAEIERRGRYRAELEDGTVLVESSNQPLLDSARVLIGQGIDPDTELVMARRATGEHSIRGKAGALAKLTVQNSQTRFRRWEDVSLRLRHTDPA